MTAIVLPLSIAGLAALTFHDWSLPLRLVAGLAGLCGVAFSVLLTLWPILYAAAFREHLAISDGVVHLRRGLPLVAKTRILGPLAELRVAVVARPSSTWRLLTEPARREGFGSCLVFLRGRQQVGQFGTWLTHEAAHLLIARVAPRLGPSPTMPPAEPERSAFKPHPRPYAWLLDLAIGLGLFVFGAWPGATDALRAAYPLAALTFFAALSSWLATRDPGHGLDPAESQPLKIPFGLALAGLALLVGAAIVPISLDVWGPPESPPVFWPMVLAIVLFGLMAWHIARRALGLHGERAARPSSTWPLDTAIFLSLLVLTGVHESWAWTWLEEARRNFGPLSIVILPTAIAILIWPGRFFYQIEQPWSDSSRWRFLALLASFITYALIGL